MNLRKLAIRRRRRYAAAPSVDGPGRAAIVERFHELRKRPDPPVMVIQGVRGAGKSRMITRLRAGYRRSRRYALGEHLDARLDFTSIAPEPEPSLMSLRQQLAVQASVWRRSSTPRFRQLQAHRQRHLARMGLAPNLVSGVPDDLRWGLKATPKLLASLHSGGAPLIAPSAKAGPVRWLRLAWGRWAPTPAGKWVRSYVENLPDKGSLGESDETIRRALNRGLSKAIAADLARMTQRRLLAISQIVIFIDAYDQIEDAASNQSWLVEFNDDLRDAGAKVMLVVGCRRQRLWSERIDRRGDRKRFGHFTVGAGIEIHVLYALDWQDRLYALERYGVPATLAEQLARLSRGHPLALSLLGMHFGNLESSDPVAMELIQRLPKPGQVPRANQIDEQWVGEFCSVVAPSLVAGLSEGLAWHARAASVLRTFDRDLLATVMGDTFRGAHFAELVQTPIVEAPRPSALLDSMEAYRVRSFARELLREDPAEREATLGWHRAASAYFDAAAEAALDPETRFALATEALFHQLFLEPAQAQTRLADAFIAELAVSRVDHCELLLSAADQVRWTDGAWTARVSALAGRMYLLADDYERALDRLTRAKERVQQEVPDDAHLAVAISQSLARCFRLQGRFQEAHVEVRFILERAVTHPVARFQGTWISSLLAKGDGDVWTARDLALDAADQLALLLANDPENSEIAARELGIAPLARKRIHIVRHRADVARRLGQYAESSRLLDEADAGYAIDREPAAEAHSRLLRADLARLNGDFAEAERVAEEVLAFFADRAGERRAAGMALRCLAQSRLGSDQPERAREPFEALLEMGQSLYPTSFVVGHFGLGELSRIAGDFKDAIRHYRAALNDDRSNDVFERIYARIAIIECHREAGELEQAFDVIGRLDGHGAVESHPTLGFWFHLTAARVHHSSAQPDATKHRELHLDRCRHYVQRFSPLRHGSGVEEAALGRTLSALAGSAALAPEVMILP